MELTKVNTKIKKQTMEAWPALITSIMYLTALFKAPAILFKEYQIYYKFSKNHTYSKTAL
jgi:hypothetical protein